MFLSSEFDRNFPTQSADSTECDSCSFPEFAFTKFHATRFHIFFTHPMIVFHAIVSSNKRASRSPYTGSKGICDMIATLSWIGIPRKRELSSREALICAKHIFHPIADTCLV